MAPPVKRPLCAARLRLLCWRLCVLETLHGYGDKRLSETLRMSVGQLELFRLRNARVLEKCYSKLAPLIAEKAAGKRPKD